MKKCADLGHTGNLTKQSFKKFNGRRTKQVFTSVQEIVLRAMFGN